MRNKNPFSIQGEIEQVKGLKIDNYSQIKRVGESVPIKNGESESISLNIEFRKIKWIFYIIFFGILAILIRIIFLQIIKGNDYRSAAEENRIRIEVVKAQRGIIYDKNKNLMVQNIPDFNLSFIPADLPKNSEGINNTINKISSIININSNELVNQIEKSDKYSYQPEIIKEHIDYEKALLLEIASSDLPGIKVTVTSTREYLMSNHFSNILGYTGKITKEELENNQSNYLYNDYIGKTGLEECYENDLKGEDGKKQIEVNSLGKENNVIAESSPKTGNNLILSIDSKLQEKLGELLDKKVNNTNAITGAAAVALDPNNGEILALVTSPTYNNNDFIKGISSEEYEKLINDPKKLLFNRPIAGEYPSGSTIKPVIASAALQEGVIDENTTVNSVGGIQIDKWFFPDWKSGGHGITDIRKALAESVNTFFYYIGGGYEDFNGLGIDRIKKYAEEFGLNNKLGIDLPGESTGFIPDKKWKEDVKGEKWYIGDTYHLSIGQGDLLVTPLQVAAYTAVIANGGTLYKPHLVKQITDAEDNIINEIKPEVINANFISAKNIEIVREGLRQAVLSGSSRAVSDLPFSVAGKTGTAQFGNEGKTHAWFSCFAPYEKPEIVIVVLVEGGGEGNETALPIAKEALAWWLSQK